MFCIISRVSLSLCHVIIWGDHLSRILFPKEASRYRLCSFSQWVTYRFTNFQIINDTQLNSFLNNVKKTCTIGTERLLLLRVRPFECVNNSYMMNAIFVVLIWKKLSSTCLQTLPNVRYGYIWRLPKKENMQNILDFQLNMQKYQITEMHNFSDMNMCNEIGFHWKDFRKTHNFVQKKLVLKRSGSFIWSFCIKQRGHFLVCNF